MKSRRKNTYDAIVFDVGDTLLIRDPPDHEVLAARCRRIGLSIAPDTARYAWKQAEFWMGEQLLQEMYGAQRMSDEELYQYLDFVALRTIFHDRTDDEIRYLATYLRAAPYQRQVWVLAMGVHTTLSSLKQSKVKLGIASNFGESLFQLCDEFGLTPYFDIIVPSSRAGVEKPDPEILLITCERLDVSPSASLYVGDHPFDVLCAKEAGMSMAWLCDPSDTLPEILQCQPDYAINSITEVLSIYRRS
jgi:putative hydrolase of the HAD superfamily